jgi:hypothetical protein
MPCLGLPIFRRFSDHIVELCDQTGLIVELDCGTTTRRALGRILYTSGVFIATTSPSADTLTSCWLGVTVISVA